MGEKENNDTEEKAVDGNQSASVSVPEKAGSVVKFQDKKDNRKEEEVASVQEKDSDKEKEKDTNDKEEKAFERYLSALGSVPKKAGSAVKIHNKTQDSKNEESASVPEKDSDKDKEQEHNDKEEE